MKVVFVSPAGQLGGAERVLLSMITVLREVADVHLVILAEGPLIRIAQQQGAVIHQIEMPVEFASLGDSGLSAGVSAKRRARRATEMIRLAPHYLKALPRARKMARRLREVITRLEPDIVHSNGNKSHLLTGFLRRLEVPVVWHLHDFVGQRPLMPWVLRWASRTPSKMIAISRAVADDAAKVLGREKIEVIYNTVDMERFCPGAAGNGQLDTLAGMPTAHDSTLRVGLVGTYANWKGQDVLLRAAAHLVQQPDRLRLRYYIIGGPIYDTPGSQFSLAHLKELAEELGIADRVGFIGFQEDVADVYRGLDIVVHASTKPEPFGLTIVEAMASGRPVIVAQAGGAAELFCDHHDALAVPPGDHEALAAAIQRLSGNPELRRQLGENARQTAAKRFAQPRLGPQLMAVYAGVMPQRVGDEPIPPLSKGDRNAGVSLDRP